MVKTPKPKHHQISFSKHSVEIHWGGPFEVADWSSPEDSEPSRMPPPVRLPGKRTNHNIHSIQQKLTGEVEANLMMFYYLPVTY